MLRIYFIYILTITLNIISYVPESNAKMLDAFSKCYVGGKDGTNINSSTDGLSTSDTVESIDNFIISSNIDLSIEQYCRSACSSLQAVDSLSNQPLNQDLVLECRNLCREADNYVYEPNKRMSFPTQFQDSATDSGTNASYNMQTQYSIIKFNGSLSIPFSSNGGAKYFSFPLEGKTKNIKLDSTYDNTIYTCGHKIITLQPTFPNMFQMSYGNVVGGNVNQLSAEQKVDSDSKITTEVLLEDDKYAGVYDFNYDKYQNYGTNSLDLESFVNAIELKTLGKLGINTAIYDGLANRRLSDNNKLYGYKSWWAASTDQSDWDPVSSTYHPCFSSGNIKFDDLDTNDGMQRMNNASIIAIQPSGDPTNKTVNISTAPEKIGCYPTWNIYNRQYVDTGIEVSNNDYLSISWGGNIIVGNGLTIPFIDLSRAKMLASGDQWIFRNFSHDKSIAKINFLQLMSSLEFENLGVLVGETGAVPQKHDDDDNTQICNGKKVYESLNTKESLWHGLTGSIDRKSGNDPKDTNNKHPDRYFKFTCHNTFLFPDRYIFSGALSGVDKTMPLRLRHYIPQSGVEQELYANSILNGGYQVTIEWGGCPIRDGQGLEYALSDDQTKPEDIKAWKTIDVSKGSGFTFVPINTKGNNTNITIDQSYDPKTYTKVFFRVNTDGLSRNNGFKPDGSYTLKINDTADMSKEYVPWYDLTKNIAVSIFQTLIGDPAMINNSDIKLDGALIQVFNSLSRSISPLIQVVLVFYVTMLGLGFMIGTIKTTQQELIVIMFKISLVFLVFSENGRAFFVNAYIKIFIIGIMELAHIMQNSVYEVLSSYGGEDYNPNVDKNDVFNIFSMWEMWSYMLKQSFTKRLLALMFSSMSGFVIALIILGSSIISIFTLLKAIMYYISSMITQGILLLIAPFFFLLNLFKITSAMFQEWTKQVIGFALAPIAITITVTLFMLLLVIGIEATMGFSYCIGCLIEMFGMCVIPAYYTLNVMFMPIDTSTSFILPIGLFAGAMSFLIIAYAGKSAVDLGFGIIMRLVTFRFETAGRSVMGDIGMNSAMSGLSGIKEVGSGTISDRNLNPLQSDARKDSWYSDFGKKNIDIALRDEKKLDEIGQKLKDLDAQPPAQNPQQGNRGNQGGNNPPGGAANP